MLRQFSALLPQGYAKWLGFALILLTPGSFLILPALALIRLCTRREEDGLDQAQPGVARD